MTKQAVGNLQGRSVFVIDGARTPFLKAMHRPGPFTASDLAVQCGRALLSRQVFDADALDEVIIGCVSPGVEEANISRIVALRLGCGHTTPAYSVQRNCASGMQSLDNAAQDIASGRADLVLAGGTEAMSHIPVVYNNRMVAWLGEMASSRYLLNKILAAAKFRPAMLKPVIGLLKGLTDPVTGLSMGQTAENLAHHFAVSREQMDRYALRSHEKLASAIDKGYMGEIVELVDSGGNCYQQDDGLRKDSSLEKLARLKPVFDKPFGHITAGNSAQVTDGAALLLLASEDAVNKYDLPVLGQITDIEWAALDPAYMGLGPVHAATPILQRHQLGLDEIDYWEINEAFAAQVLACIEAWQDGDYCVNELGLKKPLGEIGLSRLNIDGGGISLGHPVGASGARIVLHALQVMQRNNDMRAIASLCIGGGQGGAMLLEIV